MLDTTICIDLLRAGSEQVFERIQKQKIEIDDLAISSITFAELQYGAAKSARPAHHETLLAKFCAPIAILPFDDFAAQHYGMVRTALERAGTPIGPLDTLIASHALALKLTVITKNEREFRRIKNLRVENWL